MLEHLIGQVGLATLLNTRSTTWHSLDPSEQQAAKDSVDSARSLMLANPTLLKRPLLDTGDRVVVGFKRDEYAELPH
ncbi:ArsC/Spx/MgsR family protein [Halomonas sp. PR-M31]|uniref:ArsC/Spx/MgsR family protein n=1 Tax=Halomonas sp. PR-M31 TaxID=1471202 RepID=UPI000B160D63